MTVPKGGQQAKIQAGLELTEKDSDIYWGPVTGFREQNCCHFSHVKSGNPSK